MNQQQQPSAWKLRLEFAIYCIEIVAARLGCPPADVYRRMAHVGLAQDFVRHDDPLHTQSREYVTDEVIAALLRRENRMKDEARKGDAR